MALTTGQAASGTQFADAMKILYLGPLNDQVYKASVMLSRLEKNSEDVSGNYAHVPLISGRNPGVGSRKDTNGTGPTLPAIGSQTYDKATFRMGYHYGRGAISGPVMRASKSQAGAFAQALDTEMKGLSSRLPEDLNRQLWSYGHGRLGTLPATQTAGTTVEVCSKSIFSAKVGDRIHSNDMTDGIQADPTAGSVITVINLDTDYASAASTNKHQIIIGTTLAGNITVDVDALYFGSPTAASAAGDVGSSRAQEMYGIPAVVDDGALAADEGLGGETGAVAGEAGEFLDGSLNFAGIDRTAASMAFWRAQVLKGASPGTNRTVTVALLEQGFLSALTKAGTQEQSIEGFTNPGLWATIGLLHIGDRVFNDFKETLEGGWIALKFNGRPVFYDRDAPRDMIWFLDMSTLFLLTQTGYEFMDDDGSILSRVADVDAYEFALYRDVQLGCRNASRNVLIDDCQAIYNIQAVA